MNLSFPYRFKEKKSGRGEVEVDLNPKHNITKVVGIIELF